MNLDDFSGDLKVAQKETTTPRIKTLSPNS